VGAPEAPAVLNLLGNTWYRGPETEQKRVLRCIAEQLVPRVLAKELPGPSLGEGSLWPVRELPYKCTYRGARGHGEVLGGFRIHSLPAYALHDPTRYHATYQRTFPNPALDPQESSARDSEGCKSNFPSLSDAASFSCEGSILAQRLMFAVLAKDESLYEKTLVSLKRFLPIRKALPNVRMGPETKEQIAELESMRSESQSPYFTRAEQFEAERNAWIFSIGKIASVVSAAAHHMGDTPTRDSFLNFADDHSAGMIREHLRLVRGETPAPLSSHSPSDYSAFEMDLFSKIGQRGPEAFQAWLAEHEYGNPVRIEALMSQRAPHLAALGKWNREGYLPLHRGPSFLELLHRTFERRRVAELTGDIELAKRLATVGQGLSETLNHNSASYTLLFAFETAVIEAQ
jgi:hypothetical protein